MNNASTIVVRRFHPLCTGPCTSGGRPLRCHLAFGGAEDPKYRHGRHVAAELPALPRNHHAVPQLTETIDVSVHVLRAEEEIEEVARYVWGNPVRAGIAADYRVYAGSGPRPLPDLI